MQIITSKLTHPQIEELGIDCFVQCVKFSVGENLEDTFITLHLNVLGIIYSLKIPKHEADNPQNITDGWKQLISEFGVFHLLGQSKRIQDGQRDLTESELKALEDDKPLI